MIEKLFVGDIETLKEMFLFCVYIPEIDMNISFQVNKNKNQLDEMMRFFDDYQEYYFVSYNGIRFDSQVLEFIIRNYHKWQELGWKEICSLIYQKAQDTIDDSNHDIFPEYREEQLSIKQLDLFTISGYNNKNKLVSLKRLMFEMDQELIEELPIPHDKEDLSDDDINDIIHYCHNDIKATYEFYNILIGNTSHPLYKDNNQIQLRQDIEEEFGIPCLNYSDTKIGDEMIKKFYCQEKNIDYKSLPRKGFFRKSIEVKNCIASYIKFQTPELNAFLKRISKLSFSQKDDFKEEINFYGNTYSFMRGGLHTDNKPEIFIATENKLIIDLDVSSYYPAIIINNNKFPQHLGREFLRGYKQMFERRLELKPLAKTDKRIAGIVGALKLAVNSVFGKSNDMQSWMYDKQLFMFTTITGELSLMMLIEAYELAGIHVISCNTDGVTIHISKEKLENMEEINRWWIEITGYELERTDYKKIVFSTVNDYIAVKTNDEIKRKGDFLTDLELYKNKSARIIPIALGNYFVGGISVDDSIKSHTNIYDFCIRQKASKDFHYEALIVQNGNGVTNVYNKLIRYYVSNTGEKIYKVKNPTCITNAPERAQVEAGEWKCFVCNRLPKESSLANINYNYYIDKAEDIIYKIDKHYKRKRLEDKQQLSFGW
jgi:hypothetical protein